jgi:hypothetical protein
MKREQTRNHKTLAHSVANPLHIEARPENKKGMNAIGQNKSNKWRPSQGRTI